MSDKTQLVVPGEDFSWLGLDKIPKNVINPLMRSDFEFHPLDSFVSWTSNTEYLHFATKYILNMELFPFQLAVLDVFWNRRLPIFIGTRGIGKSTLLGVYALLRMLINQGSKVVIIGNGFRQSRQVMDGMISIWDNAPILRRIADKSDGPKREIDRYTFKLGGSVAYALPVGDGERVRGMRANYVLSDENGSMNEEVFNLVIQGFASVASDPVSKVKESAIVERLKKEGKWTKELEEARNRKIGGNQIIRSGTGNYAFNHFMKTVSLWSKIIQSKGDPYTLKNIVGDSQLEDDGFNWKDYSLIRIPYTEAPKGLLDSTIIAQAKASLTRSQFLQEYCAISTNDSDSFFRRSVIEKCTTTSTVISPLGRHVQFSASQTGDSNKSYVLGCDPARLNDNGAIVVLELHEDHRRLVYCWSVNRQKFQRLRRLGVTTENNYYVFLAQKIRNLTKQFNIERIELDSQGGGGAIAESLGDSFTCGDGEYPILEIINEDKPKDSDIEDGYHILDMVKPTAQYNEDANHGLLKDLETRTLLFPRFDMIELAKSTELDKLEQGGYDTYEELVEEVESLKDELTSIQMTETTTGKQHFDCKNGRKDRYSAILYANKYCRDLKNIHVYENKELGAVGGSKRTFTSYGKGKSDTPYIITSPKIRINKKEMSAFRNFGSPKKS